MSITGNRKWAVETLGFANLREYWNDLAGTSGLSTQQAQLKYFAAQGYTGSLNSKFRQFAEANAGTWQFQDGNVFGLPTQNYPKPLSLNGIDSWFYGGGAHVGTNRTLLTITDSHGIGLVGLGGSWSYTQSLQGPNLDIRPEGFAGARLHDQILPNIQTYINTHSPDVVFLGAGWNDFNQGRTLSQFTADWDSAVALIATTNSLPLVVGTIPPLGSSFLYDDNEVTQAELDEFDGANAHIISSATSNGFGLVDIFNLLAEDPTDHESPFKPHYEVAKTLSNAHCDQAGYDQVTARLIRAMIEKVNEA